MAKIKYNVKDVESKGDRPVPKPGVYRVKIISCVDAKPSGKDRRLEVQYEIQDGDSKGYRLYDYINLESEASAWKLAQFIRACGLPESGTLDPDKLVGVALNVRTRVENSEQYGTSAKPASLMPLDDNEDDEDDEDLSEDEETEDEETEEDEEDEETEEDEDEDDEEDEDELWEEDELKALDSKELKAVAEEYEDVTVPSKLTAKAKAKLIADILEAQGEGEDEEGEDEEDEEETPDYESMELADLKKLAKERKLAVKGSKKVLIARLEKDDDPFS